MNDDKQAEMNDDKQSLWSQADWQRTVRRLPFEDEPPIELVADPRCINMLRATTAILAALAVLGLFLYMVIEACLAV